MTQTISQRAAAVASQQMPKRKAKHCPVCDTNLGNPDGIRSVPQLRRYFSLIRATFQHWPEGHERGLMAQTPLAPNRARGHIADTDGGGRG